MSLNQQFVLDRTAEAGEDLPANVGVVIDANGVATLPTDATERISGITARRADSNETVQVIVHGIVPIKIATAGTLALNDYVASGANGQFNALTTGDEAGARLLQAPTNNGDLVQAFVSIGINQQGA